VSLILGIDTATDVRAGLARDGEVVASGAVRDRRAHAEQLMPLVRRLLADAGVTMAELTGIVVGVGPGPFTGLRVGVASALTLGEALGIDVRGVCSLDAIATAWTLNHRGQVLRFTADAPAEFAVVADARRKEVYWARYDGSGTRVDGPFVTTPDQVPDLPLAGPGAHLTGREPSGPTELDAGLMAAHLGHLADAGLEPLYLRRPDAEVPKTVKSTLLQARIAMMTADTTEGR
jgi:tRNA threonylcarbamoyl adenosine modification protein YeaZ